MNKHKKIKIETLPDNFKMSDKQTLVLIRDLFEMIKDNNFILSPRYYLNKKKGKNVKNKTKPRVQK